MRWVFVLLLVCLASCAAPEPATPMVPTTATATPQIGVMLITRVRPTTAVSQTTPTPLPTSTATPTPTPIIYQIEAGDTLLDLALRHGYTVADIEALNPGIQPELLQIGQPVLLPPLPTAVSQLARATPVPLQLRVTQAQLYRTTAESVWVVGELVNDGAAVVEGVRLQIDVVDGTGERVAQTAVWVAASLIPPNTAAPFGILLPSLPPDVQPVVSVVGGQSAVDLGSRYLGVQPTAVSLTSSEGQITLTGELTNTGDHPASHLRLIATFYDATGQISGFQVQEWADGVLGVGEKRPFSLTAAPPGGAVVGYGLLVQGIGD